MENNNEEMLSDSRSDLETINMSDKDINSLIDSLCNTRYQNPDVAIMDQINNNRMNNNYDPFEEERLGVERDSMEIDEEIMNDIFKSYDAVPIDTEEMNVVISNGIYEKYMEKKSKQMEREDTTMNDIENELKASLNTPMPGEIIEGSIEETTTNKLEGGEQVGTFLEEDEYSEEVIEVTTTQDITISEEDVEAMMDDSSEQVVIDVEDIDPDSVTFIPYTDTMTEEEETEEQAITDVLNELNETIATISNPDTVINAITDGIVEDVVANEDAEDEKELTEEELNDVPATTLDVSEDKITQILKDNYDTTEEDALQLVSVMNRYKAGEKFNVFDELPDSLKTVILKEAADCGASKSMVNFFAKSFINDLVNNSYLDQEITNFNEEMNEALSPMKNVIGNVLDEYNDEVKETFTTKMYAKAEEIKESDPEKSDQLIRVADNFKEAFDLTRIKKVIENPPSNINRSYKEGRDRWNRVISDFKESYKNVSPALRTLDECYNGLVKYGFREDYSKALMCLVNNSVKESMEANTVEEHIYSYYLLNGIYNLNFTANNSELTSELVGSITEVMEKIDEYMTNLWDTKKKKKKSK